MQDPTGDKAAEDDKQEDEKPGLHLEISAEFSWNDTCASEIFVESQSSFESKLRKLIAVTGNPPDKEAEPEHKDPSRLVSTKLDK